MFGKHACSAHWLLAYLRHMPGSGLFNKAGGALHIDRLPRKHVHLETREIQTNSLFRCADTAQWMHHNLLQAKKCTKKCQCDTHLRCCSGGTFLQNSARKRHSRFWGILNSPVYQMQDKMHSETSIGSLVFFCLHRPSVSSIVQPGARSASIPANTRCSSMPSCDEHAVRRDLTKQFISFLENKN